MLAAMNLLTCNFCDVFGMAVFNLCACPAAGDGATSPLAWRWGEVLGQSGRRKPFVPTRPAGTRQGGFHNG